MAKQQEIAGEFDLQGYLQESGLTLTNVTQDGKYIAQDAEGNEGEIDVNGLFQDIGVSPDKADIKFNTPDTALEVSPVSLPDRFKLEVGNEKGAISYLKQNFEKVLPHPERGLVVKNKGVWQQVDPSGLGEGDPWQMSQELAADVLESTREVGDIAASIVGGLAGGALAGLAGAPTGPGAAATATAGAVAGRTAGVAANSFAMSSLGRFFGTYEAEPEEQARDAGIDAMIALTGEAIVPGGKLIFKGGKKVVKSAGRTAPAIATRRALKSLSESVAGTSKDVLSTFISFFSGAPSKATDQMIDNMDLVDKEAKRIISKVKKSGERLTSNAIDETVASEQVGKLSILVDNYEKQVGKTFKQLEGKMLASPGVKSFTANISESIEPSLKSLASIGVINFDDKAGKYILKNKEEIAEALLGEKPVANLAGKVTKSIENVVNTMNKYVKEGQVTGRDGLKKVLEVRRTLDDMYFDLASRNTNAAKEFTSVMSESVFGTRNSLVESITKSGLGEQYRAMNKFWKDNLPVRALAKQVKNTKTAGILDPERGLNNLYKKLNTGKDADIFMRRIETMGNVAGGAMKSLANRMNATESAKYFSANMPNIYMLAGGPGVVAKAAVAGGLGLAAQETDSALIDAAAGVAALTVFPRGARTVAKAALRAPSFLNPRGTAKAAQALKVGVLGLGSKERAELLSDPQRLLRTIGAAMGPEDFERFQQLFQEKQQLDRQ